MEKIKALKSKYQFAIPAFDTPCKYIPDTIKALETDINEIHKIISDHSELSKLCNSLTDKLKKFLQTFKTKLANIPNPNYIEESGEDWVDENMPN